MPLVKKERLVATQSAHISTMTITIQALQVHNKQMTLAVFRQLPERRAYLDDWTLNPTLEHWGIVRYAVGDVAVWLVAGQHGQLVRCSLGFRLPNVSGAEMWLRQSLAQLQVAQAWAAYEDEGKRLLEAYTGPDPRTTTVEGGGWSMKYYNQREDWIKTQRLLHRPEMPMGANNQYLARITVKDAEAEITQARQDLQYAQNAVQSFHVLSALPQLFIAV